MPLKIGRVFMKFIKEHSYDIVRLYINQIGIAIFSLVLYTAVGVLEDKSLGTKVKLLLSVFATLFYFVLIYCAAWDWGAKDKIKIDGGRMEKRPLKGALLAIYANISNILLAGVCALTMGLYMAGLGETLYSVSAVFNLIIRFLSAMYLGTLQCIFIFAEANTALYFLLQAIGYMIMPVFAIGVTQFGYHMGICEKRLFPSNKMNSKKSK